MPTGFDVLRSALPSLRRRGAPLEPWNATAFLRWLCGGGLSHGELLAGRLLLGVWNPDTDWEKEAREEGLPAPDAAKRFDMLEAASVWDGEHLGAVATWLARPNKFP